MRNSCDKTWPGRPEPGRFDIVKLLPSLSAPARRWRPARHGAPICPYRSRHRAVVFRDLGPVLADGCPRSDEWLERRLQDVASGRAACELVPDRRGLRGITIETAKGGRKLKLSTIWVAERARGQGLGGLLLDRCRGRWIDSEL